MPYPPDRTPIEDFVLGIPNILRRIEGLALEYKDYDENIDEFVLKKDYVSENGLIDANSMVYHPETEEVEFGYVGGRWFRWKYWKAKNDRDVPEPGCWVVEYYQRLYDQWLIELDPVVLHTPWGNYRPDYNELPEWVSGDRD